MRKKNKKVINKKVKNATPFEYNNIQFKSKLEVYCYQRLIEEEIEAQYEKKKYELVPSFTFDNKSYEIYKTKGEKIFGLQRSLVRSITYKPDFVGCYNGRHFVIETKGFASNSFNIKWKLFKRYLYLNNIETDLYLPRNKTQVDEIIKLIKDEKN